MLITKPLLPPRAGYVEVVDENGNHIYKPTRQTEARLKKDAETAKNTKDIRNVLDSLFESEPEQESQAALEFRKAVQLFVNTIEDESSILTIPSVYPEYQVGKAYKVKDIFRYGVNSVGDPQLYQVLQAHTSAAEWTPDSATSLYKKVGVTDDGIPLWVQPLGATDAYALNDIVMHNEKKWKSTIDNNVWEPGVYGWVEVTDTDEPGGDPSETIPEFVPPSGAHDAYNIGDRVMYNGKVYESVIDGNTWSPDAYPAGWKLVE